MTDVRVTTGQVAWGFLVASAREAPSSYPAPVRFSSPTRDAIWWAWRQPNTGILSGYLCWTNSRTVLIKCRELLERDDRLSNLPSYDGRAAGPMGPAINAVIDDAMLRRLWSWLARARSEGRGVVTQALLDIVASAARTRTTPDGLAAAMIIAAWHTGGITGGSAPSLMSPSEFFLMMSPGGMPRYGESLLMVDRATDYQQQAMINNLDNVPPSGYPQLDAWRTDGRSAQPSVSTAPVTQSPASPAPAASSTSTPGGSKQGTWSSTAPVYQDAWTSGSSSPSYSNPLPVYDSFGTPQTPAPATQTPSSPTQSLPGQTGGSLPSTSTPTSSSVPPGQAPASQPGPLSSLGSLSNSVANAGQKALPYLVAAGLVGTTAALVYWAVKKASKHADDDDNDNDNPAQRRERSL